MTRQQGMLWRMSLPLLTFNRDLFADDLADHGLNLTTFAYQSGVNRMTLVRFQKTGMCNEITMARIAYALGYDLKRYLPEERQKKLPPVRRAPSRTDVARQLRNREPIGHAAPQTQEAG